MKKRSLKRILPVIVSVIVVIALFIANILDAKHTLRTHEAGLQKMIEKSFQGNVKNIERVSKGVVLYFDSETVTLASYGVTLYGQVQLNDSIVKKKGDDKFIIFRQNNNGEMEIIYIFF